MSDPVDVRVPDIGDADEVDVIEVLVAVGDRVGVEDSLVTIESDKASMEIPSPLAGTVAEIAVAVGDRVSEGSLVLRLHPEARRPESQGPPVTAHPEQPAAPPRLAPGREPAASPDPAVEQGAASLPDPDRLPGQRRARPAPVAGPAAKGAPRPHASPKVRRFARELGLDLERARGSGPAGRVLEEDVRDAVREALAAPAASAGVGGGCLFDEADVTDLDAFRRAHAGEAADRGVELGLLPFVVKAAALALREQAEFAVEGASGAHLGVGVAGPEGLRFRVVRDVDGKGLIEIATELASLADGSSQDAEETGVFEVLELDVAGPASWIRPPCVASLAIGRSRIRTVWQDGAPAPAQVLPLTLAWSPHVADPASAARFLAHLRHTLTDLTRLLL